MSLKRGSIGCVDPLSTRQAAVSLFRAMEARFPNDWSALATVAGGLMYRTTAVKATEVALRLAAGTLTEDDEAALRALPEDALRFLGYTAEEYLCSVAATCLQWPLRVHGSA